MPENYDESNGVELTPEQIEEQETRERTERISAIKYHESLGDEAFETAMTQLIEATLEFAPIKTTNSNYERVKGAAELEAMFAELLNGRNEFAYMIPTKYGIRDKMSDIFKAAYLHKYGITVGPEGSSRTATIEEVADVINGAQEDLT